MINRVPKQGFCQRALWRISEWLLAPDMADEVLGDLIEESKPGVILALRAFLLAVMVRLSLGKRRRAPAAYGLAGPTRRRLSSIPEEMKYALRRLQRAPMFTGLSIATLTIGTAASLAVFALVDGVLLQPLPFAEPHELVAVFTTEREGAETKNPSSPADFLDWQQSAKGLTTLAAAEYWNPSFFRPDSSTDPGSTTPRQKLVGLRVTNNLLDMLGVEPLMGRLFEPSDQEDTVVVSAKTWQQRLGHRGDVIGSEISLDGRRHTVIGVMPESFAFPPFWATTAELWVPRATLTDPSRGARSLRVFGRLAEGTSLSSLNQMLNGTQDSLAERFPRTNTGTGVAVEALKEPVIAASRAALVMLAIGAGLLLALMTTNLAALLLARGLERRSALATQLALGASRTRITLGLMLESLILMATAGGLGSALGAVTLRAFKVFGEGTVPRLHEVELSLESCVVATAALATIGLAVGLIPGLRLAIDGERSLSKGSSRFVKADLWRRALVTTEVAITTALLLLAGLVGRSFDRLASQDLGFEITSVTAVDIDLGQTTAETEGAELIHARHLERLIGELGSNAEVSSVGAVNHLPLAGDLWRGRVFAVGSSSPEDDTRAALRVATPGYFEAMSMRLHSGRLLSDMDRNETEPVVVINQSLAQALWPGKDPTGEVLATNSLEDDSARLRVVGVIENVKQESIGDESAPEIYYPFSQNPFAWNPRATIVIRTHSPKGLDAEKLLLNINRTVPGIALGIPITLQEVVSKNLGDERIRTFVLFLFAGLATLLATTGLFGVVAFAAHQRRQELGLRLALGSNPRGVVWLILREGAALAILGSILGGLAALASGPMLRGVLFETSSLDMFVWCSVSAVVLVLTLTASLPPALRASRTNPARVLDRL